MALWDFLAERSKEWDKETKIVFSPYYHVDFGCGVYMSEVIRRQLLLDVSYKMLMLYEAEEMTRH